VVERAANQMTNLLEGLLDVSRFERGVILLNRDHTVLQTLITVVVQAMHAEATQRNLALTEFVVMFT
jgi:signal transduction histidine kinase